MIKGFSKTITLLSCLVLISCTGNNPFSTTPDDRSQYDDVFNRSNRYLDDYSDDDFELPQFVAQCEKQSSFSVSGYIEGHSCEMDSFEQIDKFYLPPEYLPSRAVIIPSVITQFSPGESLIKAITESDSEAWLLSSNAEEFSVIKSKMKIQNNNIDLSDKLKEFNVYVDSIWARDWAPLMAVPNSSYTGEKVDLKMMDTNYFWDRPLDESVSRQIREDLILNKKEMDISLKIKRVSLPIYMEGGNIMCNENNCFLSDEVILENSTQENEKDIILDENKLKQEFNKQISQNIWFVEGLPHEQTKHIDMWSKFLNKDTLLIAELTEESLKKAPTKYHYDRYKEIQTFLDMQATGKDNNGNVVNNSISNIIKQQNPNIQIIRIPMPLPEENEEGYEVFRSYTNSLILNGNIIVPKYLKNTYKNEPYSDNDLIQDYERKVTEIYQNSGYKVKWIDADEFIDLGGAIHCVTMQVPAT